LAITFLLDDDSPSWVLAATVIASSFSWLIASFIFAGIREPDTRDEALPRDPEEKNHWWRDCVDLLVEDVNFRKFVIVRSLMLVTALSTAFIVTLAAEAGQDITALGFFVIASGLASMVGGRISGIWSDRSSRDVMAGGALLGSLVLFALVASAQWAPSTVNVIAFPAGFFLVNLAHTAIRVARKTYVVDMAEGDQRTRYVAAANTLMGVILLVVGAISGAIAMLGTRWALIFLAIIGLVGVVFSRTLEEVSAPQSG
ncbi:MAG: MFS transporter, partial [Corynebacterium sp.]|nr:MFS transporter [Corynebacterium sp.]